MRFPEYLAAKGIAKTLTRKEASIFKIPYPPPSGWPIKYASIELTPEILNKLEAAFGKNLSESGLRVQRGIAAASGEGLPEPQKKTTRQNASGIGAPCRVCDAARTLLEYSGDDVARIMAALNVLREEVGRASSVPVTLQACSKHASENAPSIATSIDASARVDDASSTRDDGPPWVV